MKKLESAKFEYKIQAWSGNPKHTYSSIWPNRRTYLDISNALWESGSHLRRKLHP